MKTKEIKIRLSDQDHAKLTKAAQKLGQPLAVYLLSAALEKTDKASKPSLEDRIAALENNLVTPRERPIEDRPSVAKTSFQAQLSQHMSELITKTELQDRLASTQPVQKAKMIPASLMKTSTEKLIDYTKERDPEGYAWQPTNPERSLWHKC